MPPQYRSSLHRDLLIDELLCRSRYVWCSNAGLSPMNSLEFTISLERSIQMWRWETELTHSPLRESQRPISALFYIFLQTSQRQFHVVHIVAWMLDLQVAGDLASKPQYMAQRKHQNIDFHRFPSSQDIPRYPKISQVSRMSDVGSSFFHSSFTVWP